MSIPSLFHMVASTLDMETLYTIYKKSNIIGIEKEIERRLISCDPALYLPTVNFIYDHIDDNIILNQWLKSNYISNGINTVIHCLPWKIGVIYNYTDQSYIIKQLSIIVGREKPYKIKGKYFKPSWINSQNSKLTLREVISDFNKPINDNMSHVVTNLLLDNRIRMELLTNDIVAIDTCVYFPRILGEHFKSYPGDISLPEVKQIYPCIIETKSFKHNLVPHISPHMSPNNVKVHKYPIVNKLLHLQRIIEN